jgi:hypothetical protein
MFSNFRQNETSLSRAHNSSYSDILFHLTRSKPIAIPLNFSNTYFYDLLAVGIGRFGDLLATYSFAEKIRFGVTNGPHDNPTVTNLQVYGFTSIRSDFRNHALVSSANNINLQIFTTKVNMQDFLCFTYSQVGTTWTATDDFTILFKGTVVVCPALWDYHAHKFITDIGLTQSSQGDQIRTSITRLVCDLKSKYLWNKIICLYPFVGGTSQSHRFNLKDTSTYSLVYSGSIFHSEDGARFNNNTYGFMNTNFPVRPTTRDLAMGVYTDQVVSTLHPIGGTYGVGHLMGSFTTSNTVAGGELYHSISIQNINWIQPGNTQNFPQIVYMDVDPLFLRGRYSSQLTTNWNNTIPIDKGGLWAMARVGSSFSYLGLQIPGVIQLNSRRWYEPNESSLLSKLRSSFGRKRVFYEGTLGVSYFTSSIYIGSLNGTTSMTSPQTIKSAFIGFTMSAIDLLYMSEILTKFNHSLNRE